MPIVQVSKALRTFNTSVESFVATNSGLVATNTLLLLSFIFCFKLGWMPYPTHNSSSSSFNSHLSKTNKETRTVAELSGTKPEPEVGPRNRATTSGRSEDSPTGNSSFSGSSTTPDAAFEKIKNLAGKCSTSAAPTIQVERIEVVGDDDVNVDDDDEVFVAQNGFYFGRKYLLDYKKTTGTDLDELT